MSEPLKKKKIFFRIKMLPVKKCVYVRVRRVRPAEGDSERSVNSVPPVQRLRRSHNGVMCWGSVYRAG